MLNPFMYNPVYVGITGPGRSGKTTLGRMIDNVLAQQHGDLSVITAGISTPFKMFWIDCMGMNGLMHLERVKDEKVDEYEILHRTALEQLGDWGRAIHPNFWLDTAHRMHKGEANVIIIPDVRVDDEAKWIREKGGRVLHISSSRESPVVSTHHTQTVPVTFEPTDIRIVNDGTLEELEAQVLQVASLIFGIHKFQP